MKTVTITIPDTVDEKEFKMQLATHLFKNGLLSSIQATELAGVSKRHVIESFGRYGVSVFGKTVEDVEKTINE